MNIDELNSFLDKSSDGKWKISKISSDYVVENHDSIKEYIYALNQRLNAPTMYVFWLFLAFWVAIIFFANVKLNIEVPYIVIFSGWLAGGLLFLFLFVIYSLVNTYHIHSISPKFKEEFYQKSIELKFTRDMLLTEKWVDPNGGIVKSELAAGIFKTEK